MAVSKAYLKAFVRERGDLAAALSQLNEELVAENDEAMFLTAFCAEIDLQSGECVYVNGGQGSPLILRASGSIEELPQVKGPLIGLESGARFEAGRFRLDPGDLLLGMSDGVADAEDSGGSFFGEERARALLATLRGVGAREVVEGMERGIGEFTRGAAPSDDITLLALRRLA